MEIERIKAIIEEKYAELTGEVIAEAKTISPASADCDTQYDSETVWEEFARQVQDEDGMFYADYEELIEELCNLRMEHLSDTEIKLLWLGSGGYVARDPEDPLAFPSEEQMLDEILEELFSWVEQKAADIDLETMTEKIYEPAVTGD